METGHFTRVIEKITRGGRSVGGAAGTAEDVRQLGGDRVVTRWLDDEILEATHSGYLSEGMLEETRWRFWRVAGARNPRFALLDMAAITGFSSDVVHPGRRFLTEFKERGGEQIVVVTTKSDLRMLASTLMFATNASIRFAGTREGALTRLYATKTIRNSWQ
jgi:hypothetical protein